MALFNNEEINWTAYEQGQLAWKEYLETNIKPINPYPQYCNSWYSWNRGWNS